MKKVISMCLASLLLIALFTGCSNEESSSSSSMSSLSSQSSSLVDSSLPSNSEPESELYDIIDKVNEKFPLSFPDHVVDDTTLNDVYYLDDTLVEDYAISYAQVNVKAEDIAIVKAKEGKTDEVKKMLEKRLEDVKADFESYLPEQYEIAQRGKVFTYEDYVVLVIADDVEEIETLIKSELENLTAGTSSGMDDSSASSDGSKASNS